VKYNEVKHNLKIPGVYKGNPVYIKAKADLDKEIKQYKISGSVCYKKATQSGANSATHTRLNKCVQLVTPLAKSMVRCLCSGNSLVHCDVCHVPVECQTLACIIAFLHHKHTQSTPLFDSYIVIPADQLSKEFVASFKEIPLFQRTGNATPFVPMVDNTRTMGSNASENNNLVNEGTNNLSPLNVIYTKGVQI
jgi:hypothetical protein